MVEPDIEGRVEVVETRFEFKLRIPFPFNEIVAMISFAFNNKWAKSKIIR